MQITNVGNNTD